MTEERSAWSVSDDERNAIYQRLWEEGGMRFLFNSFSDLMIDQKANETASAFLRAKIREIVKDQDVAEKLCPKYPFGTKRPTTNIGYYEMFNRDNVRLVCLRDDPIQEITETGIRTKNEHHDLDLIVFATGFDAITGSLSRIDIRGRGGVALREKWADGARTFLGVGVSGFPNLFTIQGPQSPNVMSNAPVSSEQHVNWFADCIRHMREKGHTTMEPTEQAEAGWGTLTNMMFGHMVPNTEGSYITGANVPGKPRVFLAFLGGVGMYRQHCAEVAKSGYPGFLMQ
jgi:cyclohexanone monooxygenase